MTIILSGTPTLETERLILRGPQAGDVDAFVDFYQTDRAQYVGGPLDARAAWNLFGAQYSHWAIRGFGMFAVTRKGDNTTLGIIGHWFPPNWPETEIGWILYNPADQGQGLAAEAARACIDHAWTTLKWDTIVSYIDPANAPSIVLAERLGATLDVDAPQPKPEKPCLVYRHPKGTA